VAVGVAVLGAEDGTDLEDLKEVRGDGHLLVELGALGEAALTTEVVELEDVGTTLGETGDDLGGVDLDEVLVDEVLAEVLADLGLEAEDGVVGEGAEVNPTVVETGLLENADIAVVTLDLLGQVVVLLVIVTLVEGVEAVSIGHLEGEESGGSGHDVDSLDVDLGVLLGAGLDGDLGLDDGTVDIDDGLGRDLGSVLDEVDRGLTLVAESAHHELSSAETATELDEAGLTLATDSVDTSTDPDLLTSLSSSDLSETSELAVSDNRRVDEGEVTEVGSINASDLNRSTDSLLNLLDRLLLLRLLLLLSSSRVLRDFNSLDLRLSLRHDFVYITKKDARRYKVIKNTTITINSV